MKTSIASSLLYLALAWTSKAHMEMSNPLPIRSSFDMSIPEPTRDYNLKSPITANGSNYPCHGYHNERPILSKATYVAGSQYSMSIAGAASHGGGSCQLSLSYDNGGTWKVIKSMIGACPLTSTYQFTVPAYAPSGNALFAWTWFNEIGNREMYMNCAWVTIRGSSSARRKARKTKRQGAFTSMASLPTIWRANIAGLGTCGTIEGTDPVFANPGPDVVYGGRMSASDPVTNPGQNCDNPEPRGQMYQAGSDTSALGQFPGGSGGAAVPAPAPAASSAAAAAPAQPSVASPPPASNAAPAQPSVAAPAQPSVAAPAQPSNAAPQQPSAANPAPSSNPTPAQPSAAAPAQSSNAPPAASSVQPAAASPPASQATASPKASMPGSPENCSTTKGAAAAPTSSPSPAGGSSTVSTKTTTKATTTTMMTSTKATGTTANPPATSVVPGGATVAAPFADENDLASFLPCVPGSFLCLSATRFMVCGQTMGGVPWSPQWRYIGAQSVALGMACQPYLARIPDSDAASRMGGTPSKVPAGYFRSDRYVGGSVVTT